MGLSLGKARSEEWVDVQVCQAIESPLERVARNLKMVNCAVEARSGIEIATVIVYVGHVCTLARELWSEMDLLKWSSRSLTTCT